MGEMVRALWIVASLSAVISIILSRSGFASSQWLGIPSLLLVCTGAILSLLGIVQISRGFRAYAAQTRTLGSFDHKISRQAALRFAGLQVLAVGVMIGLAATGALALPGLAVQAPIVAVVLAASLWALQPGMLRRPGSAEALERLVSGAAQMGIADRLPFWQRPDAG